MKSQGNKLSEGQLLLPGHQLIVKTLLSCFSLKQIKNINLLDEEKKSHTTFSDTKQTDDFITIANTTRSSHFSEYFMYVNTHYLHFTYKEGETNRIDTLPKVTSV
jgi:hypothetical protein